MIKFRFLSILMISALFLTGYGISDNAAFAATITVTNASDDSGTGDGCTLREAIINANANAATFADCEAGTGDDIIVFDSVLNGTPVTLAIAGSDNTSFTGDLDITDTLTVTGNGQTETIIQAGTSDSNGIDRVFNVINSDASFEGVTIRHGNNVSHYGGGILIQGNNTVSLTDCTISNNTAGSYGGGIYNEEGALNLTGCTISNNDGNSYGGGLYNEYGILNLINCTLSNNKADNSSGGAIYNDYAPGTVNFTGCTISNNTSKWGGGIHNENDGAVVTLINSTVNGNTASSQDGGGINNNRGTINLTNTTVSGNTASNDGGGIFNNTGTVNTVNATVAFNVADNDSNNSGNGGGIGNNTGTVNISNTLIAMNTDNGGEASNCSGDFVSQDFNLIGDSTGHTITGTSDNNIIESDPLLAALSDNGGLTQTHALTTGSRAMEAGDCNGGAVNKDQRGVDRPQGSACDIGAFEYRYSADLAVTKTVDQAKVTAGGALIYSISVTNNGPDTASSVQVLDALPDGVIFGSVKTTKGSCTEVNGFVTCEPGDLADSESFDIKIVATTTVEGTITNTAEVSSDITDNDTANNTASVDVTVGTDATITVTNATDLIAPGDGCSLREAIINANDNADTYSDCEAGAGVDTIVFDAAINGTPITLTLSGDDDTGYVGDLDITDALAIKGNGQNETIIQGGENKESGIDLVFFVYGVDVCFENMAIRYGTTPGYGGGIYVDGSKTTTLTNCTVSENTADYIGGGIHNYEGLLVMNNCIVKENTAGSGGGVYTEGGIVTITNSTISNNTANGWGGGGLYNYDYGATMTLTNCTVSNNHAAKDGGGFYNEYDDSTLNLTNCTLSGNTTDRDGGGIYNYKGVCNLKNTTVAFNIADNETNGTGDGGGIATNTGTVNISNTLIAMNTDNSGEAPNCSGVFVSQDYNLIGDETGYTITGTTEHNIIAANPLLAALADNGGATLTHALLTGSPAIDAGDGSGGTFTSDQRGIDRPQGAACDIGAVEYRYFADLSVTKTTDQNNVTAGDALTYTISVTNNGPEPALAVQVVDTLPDSLNFVTAIATKGSCSETAGVITCGTGNLAVDETVTIEVTVTTTITGTTTNTVTASSDTADPDTQNNTASADVIIATTPAVSTGAVSNIITTSADCGGNVTTDGGADVTARGICWSTNENPTIGDSFTEDESGTGDFTSKLTDLEPATTYYVKAYATNISGTVYGEQVTFTTLGGGSSNGCFIGVISE